MMTNIKKEIKQNSSIHQKIRKAAFVEIESENTKRFKYNVIHSISGYYHRWLPKLEKRVNTFIHFLKTKLDVIDFKKIINCFLLFMGEAFIEGLGLNFCLNQIAGVKMNFLTIFAWGIALKQGLGIHKRIKQNGKIEKLSETNKFFSKE